MGYIAKGNEKNDTEVKHRNDKRKYYDHQLKFLFFKLLLFLLYVLILICFSPEVKTPVSCKLKRAKEAPAAETVIV